MISLQPLGSDGLACICYCDYSYKHKFIKPKYLTNNKSLTTIF